LYKAILLLVDIITEGYYGWQVAHQQRSHWQPIVDHHPRWEDRWADWHLLELMHLIMLAGILNRDNDGRVRGWGGSTNDIYYQGLPILIDTPPLTAKQVTHVSLRKYTRSLVFFPTPAPDKAHAELRRLGRQVNNILRLRHQPDTVLNMAIYVAEIRTKPTTHFTNKFPYQRYVEEGISIGEERQLWDTTDKENITFLFKVYRKLEMWIPDGRDLGNWQPGERAGYLMVNTDVDETSTLMAIANNEAWPGPSRVFCTKNSPPHTAAITHDH
jgi:hypothetical protein